MFSEPLRGKTTTQPIANECLLMTINWNDQRFNIASLKPHKRTTNYSSPIS